MPCTYTGSLLGDRELAAREALDQRERMLCAICSHAERVYGPAALETLLRNAAKEAAGLNEMSITRWWSAHKKAEGRT